MWRRIVCCGQYSPFSCITNDTQTRPLYYDGMSFFGPNLLKRYTWTNVAGSLGRWCYGYACFVINSAWNCSYWRFDRVAVDGYCKPGSACACSICSWWVFTSLDWWFCANSSLCPNYAYWTVKVLCVFSICIIVSYTSDLYPTVAIAAGFCIGWLQHSNIERHYLLQMPSWCRDCCYYS